MPDDDADDATPRWGRGNLLDCLLRATSSILVRGAKFFRKWGGGDNGNTLGLHPGNGSSILPHSTAKEAIERARRALAKEERMHGGTIEVIRSDGNHSYAVRISLADGRLVK